MRILSRILDPGEVFPDPTVEKKQIRIRPSRKRTRSRFDLREKTEPGTEFQEEEKTEPDPSGCLPKKIDFLLFYFNYKSQYK